MPLLVLVIFILWTMIVFRLLAFRTTLGARTLATFAALGALLGTVGTPLVEKFFNSYRYDGNQLYVVLIIAVQHLLMALPVLILLMRPAWRRGSSVCDAFLAAFAVGAGYEFLGVFLALAPAQGIAGNLSFLPPGTASTATITVAGYAYWTALVTLAFAASFRFLRNPALAYGVSAIALLVSALDHYGYVAATPAGQRVSTLTLHGSLLPWLVIVLLIAAVVVELRWAASQDKLRSKTAIKDVIAEFQAVAAALVTFKLNAARLAGTRCRLARQSEILAAELEREPGNANIQRQAESIKTALARIATIQPAPQAAPLDWLKRRWPQLLAVISFLFLGFFLSMPNMGGLPAWVWTSLPLAARFAPFQLTLVITAVMVILVWLYVRGARQPFSLAIADEVAQFSAELRILQVGIGIVLVGLLYPHPVEFMAFQSSLARAAGLQIPGFNEIQLLTLLTLLACAVSAVTARRAERWRKISGPNYLGSLARNLISFCSITIVAWLSFAFFTQAQVYAHANFGAKFFNVFHTNGNSILEMFLGLATAVFSWGVALLVRMAETRFEGDLLQADAAASAPAAKAASTGAGK